MKTIEQIYEEYKIMPNLREHMYRVAAVASIICSDFTEPIDKKEIIYACLLHDMGNIIKFDLNYFPEFLEPEGYDYWKKVQDDYKNKYGPKDHETTLLIVKELDIDVKILDLVDSFGFSRSCKNVSGNNFSKKICCYADMRVVPHGVVSLEDRFKEGIKRYSHPRFRENADMFKNCIRELEKQIFSKATINPQDIRDEKVSDIIKKLKEFYI